MGKKADRARKKAKKAQKKMQALIGIGERYYIDFLPRENNTDMYPALEAYLLETYLAEYAKKISNIVLKLISYYSAKVYVTNVLLAPETSASEELQPFEEKNLGKRLYSELDRIVQLVVMQNAADVQIYFPKIPFVLLVHGDFTHGEFATEIFIEQYCQNFDHMRLLKSLVQEENLYLKKASGIFAEFP